METKKQELMRLKRPYNSESENMERPKKQPTTVCVKIEDNVEGGVEKIFKFRVLFPNGMSVGLKIRDPGMEWHIEEFISFVKDEYFRAMREIKSQNPKRRINWTSKDLHFVDARDDVIKRRINFRNFEPNKCHILRLHDGSEEAETYENMWDLTPDTDLLRELPEEYTFETALADLIDNSLQAVWSNGVKERRLVSVEVNKERITIFDSGPGMDSTDENSIVKWGKMGASLHRSSRGHGIGGKPPYLTPVFGMFGYGGPIASMHLGRHALVSSKTKESKKVYTLHLEREALLTRSGSEKTWRTDGGIRPPKKDETRRSPHGSFTKVEIFEPKMKDLDIMQLQCKLKDIYFPYIQCDEASKTRRTIMPVGFEVNGTDLAEIQGGEVAITNLHSCNGPEFILQLRFRKDATSSPGVKVSRDANARLRFIYFPVIEGKESIDRILEKLDAEGCGIRENFESFSRVSIWRLGRLLPDARWKRLPFMEPKKKVGDKAQILKRCCLRVKCFIDTDAGFNPTPSKTDLAHHHPYTTVLMNFGGKPLEKDKEVHLEISKDGKEVALSQLEKQYEEWIFQMHENYDEVIECGEDQPLLVVSPLNKKKLAISSDVLRVHKEIQRKGASWKSGQKIKVLKGACAGCHKNNMYATLECIVLEGFQGDSGGEARVICSPLGLPRENSCLLSLHDDGSTGIDIRDSVSLPISVIDSGKCMAIESAEWDYLVLKHRQKMPSTIEILSARHCQELEVEGDLPAESTIYAGHSFLKEIVAVIRPASFNSASATKNLDQKHIVISKEDLEMGMQIKFRTEDKTVKDFSHIYSGYIKPSSRKGFQGLYIFPVGHKLPGLFEKAGHYTFLFSFRESSIGSCERRVQVKALSQVGSWRQSCDGQAQPFNVRVGLSFPPISIACYDIHGNRIPFASVPEVMIKIKSRGGVLANVNRRTLDLSSDKLTLKIKDALIECNGLDKIKPNYEATLIVSQRDGLFRVSFPCQVFPGTVQCISTQPRYLDQQLLPGHAIKELILEMLDGYGNHVEGGLEVLLNMDGFSFEDHLGFIRMVDQQGCLDLSGLLKVTGGYGRKFLICDKLVFKKEFETEKRELRALSEVPEFCVAGSVLENMVFVVINTEGNVDETIHDDESCGQSHMLVIKSQSLDRDDDSVKYSFHHGRCVVRFISLPQEEGIVQLVASHSRYQELQLTIEVHVVQAPKMEPETIQTPYTDGKVFLLQGSSVLKASKAGNDGVDGQYFDEELLLLQDSSASKDVHDFMDVIMNDQKELEEAMFAYGSRVGDCESILKMLNAQQEKLNKELSILQASLGPNFSNHFGNATGKEAIIKLIESKGDCAAAVVCRLLKEIPSPESHNNVIENILGVVALLGTVQISELSRVLAEYLGEDKMLAVVCKSYAAVDALENYEQYGNVDGALHPEATKLAQSIRGRFDVICLEDTRPYAGKLCRDPDRKLALPDPTLPNGNTPSGYLGYAVNLVNLEYLHLQTRTDAGHGLRETLFYCLFGEIQVYKTREDMKMAKACIKTGAVSLDGGIMKGNGVLSLGHREPEICFAVIAPGSQRHPPPNCIRILMQIEKKECQICKVLGQIEKVTKGHKKALERFSKRRDRYAKFLDQKGPLLQWLQGQICEVKNTRGQF